MPDIKALMDEAAIYAGDHAAVRANKGNLAATVFHNRIVDFLRTHGFAAEKEFFLRYRSSSRGGHYLTGFIDN